MYFCYTSFSPIKQLDVSTPVVQEEAVDSPPSDVIEDTDVMEVNTQHVTPLQPEVQGTTVFAVKLTIRVLKQLMAY